MKIYIAKEGYIMNKKVFVIIISIILILMIAACAYASEELETEYFFGGDVWIRASIDELANTATDVIRAEVINSRVERVNTLLAELDSSIDMERFYVIHTIYELKVLETFKGDTQVGDIIEIMQRGGRLGNRELIYDRKLQIVSGDDAIFFLRSFEEQGFGHLPMAIEGGFQGAFRVSSLDTDVMNELSESIANAYRDNIALSDLVLESYDPNNALTLTIGDLMRISDIEQ